MGSLLLDTHAAIWVSMGMPVSDNALAALASAKTKREFVYVSPISAWEIGILVRRGRLNLLSKPETWFEQLLAVPGLSLANMAPDILIASSFLPASDELRDPADRVLAATAREFGYTLMTRDRLLLRYAEKGHLRAVDC